MAFLCVSQQGEFKNTTNNFLEEVHVKKQKLVVSRVFGLFSA
jgi:hypothetical protein